MLQISEHTSSELMNGHFNQTRKHEINRWVLAKGKEEQEEDQKVG